MKSIQNFKNYVVAGLVTDRPLSQHDKSCLQHCKLEKLTMCKNDSGRVWNSLPLQELNTTAVRKIIKKFDKRFHATWSSCWQNAVSLLKRWLSVRQLAYVHRAFICLVLSSFICASKVRFHEMFSIPGSPCGAQKRRGTEGVRAVNSTSSSSSHE